MYVPNPQSVIRQVKELPKTLSQKYPKASSTAQRGIDIGFQLFNFFVATIVFPLYAFLGVAASSSADQTKNAQQESKPQQEQQEQAQPQTQKERVEIVTTKTGALWSTYVQPKIDTITARIAFYRQRIDATIADLRQIPAQLHQLRAQLIQRIRLYIDAQRAAIYAAALGAKALVLAKFSPYRAAIELRFSKLILALNAVQTRAIRAKKLAKDLAVLVPRNLEDLKDLILAIVYNDQNKYNLKSSKKPVRDQTVVIEDVAM